MTQPTILPGATLGVIGDGQLGRMFAVAARRMGYRVRVLGSDRDAPAAQVADEFVQVDWEAPDLPTLCDQLEVVTYETENLPLSLVEQIGERVPVTPDVDALRICQNRWHEKSMLRQLGLPVADFRAVSTREELHRAVDDFQANGVVKTTTGGYDGHGQWRIACRDDVATCESEIEKRGFISKSSSRDAAPPLIMEAFVTFDLEFSVIVARSRDGGMVTYGPFHNCHRNHILDLTSCPADLSPRTTARAIEMAKEFAAHLNFVGVCCLEFFLTSDGNVVVNEIAPRPHNSGHATIEAHATSQFAQQVRTICGLPVGSAEQLRPAAMANLLGDIWLDGPVPWNRALDLPDVHLHLYGKKTPRGRPQDGPPHRAGR